MNLTIEPYFMNNKDWYYYDSKNWIYKLTGKAPQKAIDSYIEFYSPGYDDNPVL